MAWHDALELNSHREITGGSPELLREDIRRAADLRIYTAFRHNDHLDTHSANTEVIDEVSDFRTTYLIDDRWAAGIMSLRMPINPPVGFGPRPSMSFFLYNEDGQQAIARPYFDGGAPKGQPGQGETWKHADMPKYRELSRWDDHTNAPSSNFIYSFEKFRYITNPSWTEVLAHDADGSIRQGSLDALAQAFVQGCDVKVGIEGLCSDLGGSSLPHTVFAHCGPGYYHRESQVFCAGTQPVVRVAPNIPMSYESRNWDFGWLFVRTDGLVEYWRCDPYTMTFSKTSRQLAVHWFVR